MGKEHGIEELLNEDFWSRYKGLLTLSDLPIAVVDKNGRILSEFISLPDFCKYVCQEEEGDVCPHILKFIEKGMDGEYLELPECKNGLRSLMAPVRDAGKVPAYIIGGFVYFKDTEYLKFMLDLRKLGNRHSRDDKFVAKACAALRTVSPQKSEAHRQLCIYLSQSFSRWISGAGPAEVQSIEKDLLERRIRELESRDGPIMVDSNFLFSTLNCIARIAYFEKAKETETLIYYLSDILRSNARTEFYLKNLQTEMDVIDKYLYIQKARFKSRLFYDIDLPSNLKSCKIPNMVLLPIVQNALVHGILLKREGGNIKIKVEGHEDKIIIFVIDNGQGFIQSKLEELRAGDFVGDDNSSLCLTNRRLKNYYGKNFGIDVIKSDYSGSTVSITIANSTFTR